MGLQKEGCVQGTEEMEWVNKMEMMVVGMVVVVKETVSILSATVYGFHGSKVSDWETSGREEEEEDGKGEVECGEAKKDEEEEDDVVLLF
ncbi:hypothetical protein ACLB2K_052845 [Fragaria x ananassa]